MNDFLKLKAQITSRFKISGFQIRTEPSLFLAEQLLPLSTDEQKEWLQNITNHVQSQGLETPNVEKKHLELAIKEANNTGLDTDETVFSVVNAFDVPKFKYNSERNKFLLDNRPKGLLPSPDAKADYLRERYHVLLQRTMRHDLFSVKSSISTEKHLVLRKIENLLSTSKMNDVILLGLLTQLTEGKFYLEDPTGVVPIDLSEAIFSSGLFCEGCFLLVSGTFNDGVLKINEVGFPIPELARVSRAYFGTANSWGGKSKTLLKSSRNLSEIEKSNSSDSIVFLSDCWLDNTVVLEKLEALFRGYDEYPPNAIVMMGPFAKNFDDIYQLKKRFQVLGELFAQCDNLRKETNLVLVPSSEDPSAANILPRPPLPEILVEDLRKKVPKLFLATNPCRLQYCTQQILVFRSDLVTKFCRNAIYFPKEGSLEDHFTRTLISQGTLAPLNPIVLPTHWNYDAALSLYPLPDLIVIGDPSQGFHRTEQECIVLNTGSFPKSKFSFNVYEPSSKTVEESQIPDDD